MTRSMRKKSGMPSVRAFNRMPSRLSAFNWARVPQVAGPAQDAVIAANAAARDAAGSPEVVNLLKNAQAVFFTGGDQYGYIQTFHGTTLQSTIEGNFAGGKFVIGRE